MIYYDGNVILVFHLYAVAAQALKCFMLVRLNWGYNFLGSLLLYFWVIWGNDPYYVVDLKYWWDSSLSLITGLNVSAAPETIFHKKWHILLHFFFHSRGRWTKRKIKHWFCYLNGHYVKDRIRKRNFKSVFRPALSKIDLSLIDYSDIAKKCTFWSWVQTRIVSKMVGSISW